jgi:hypothetical protein
MHEKHSSPCVLPLYNMMTFAEFPYIRPNLEQFTTDFNLQLQVFHAAKTAQEQIAAIDGINTIRSGFDTMGQICMIRHTIDTPRCLLCR